MDIDFLIKKIQTLKDNIELDEYDEDHIFFILSKVKSFLSIVKNNNMISSESLALSELMFLNISPRKIVSISELNHISKQLKELKSYFNSDM